jgi:pyruvate kinase
LQDLQGPKIRVGELPNPLFLERGEIICLYAQDDTPPEAGMKSVPVDFPELFDSVKVDDCVLLDDGHIGLSVKQVSGRTLQALVGVGGKLSSHKGINLPGVQLTIPGFTEKDRADLIFGMEHDVDMVAISFVRTPEDILTVRREMEKNEHGSHPLVIAKLERPEALQEENLKGILDVADGVMVARGDLGVEMAPERVPIEQKRIIAEANYRNKIVITATQMLESMILNPLPTRAEASDVANAIFDGTDAVMLSAESASGAYPVESVAMMSRIVCTAEEGFKVWGHYHVPESETHDDIEAVTRAARELAHDLNVAAIAVFTQSGLTAQMMSKVRPRVPIYAFTPSRQTYQRMALLWGVVPYLVSMAETLRDIVKMTEAALKENGYDKEGQQVVIVSGFPVQSFRKPNLALLHTIGDKM